MLPNLGAARTDAGTEAPAPAGAAERAGAHRVMGIAGITAVPPTHAPRRFLKNSR